MATEAVDAPPPIPLEVLGQVLEIERANAVTRDQLLEHVRARSFEVAGWVVIPPTSKHRVETHTRAIAGTIMGLPKGPWKEARIRFANMDTAVLETIDGRLSSAFVDEEGNVHIGSQDMASITATRQALAALFPGDPWWPPKPRKPHVTMTQVPDMRGRLISTARGRVALNP